MEFVISYFAKYDFFYIIKKSYFSEIKNDSLPNQRMDKMSLPKINVSDFIIFPKAIWFYSFLLFTSSGSLPITCELCKFYQMYVY